MQALKQKILFYTQHLYAVDLLFIMLVLFIFICILLAVVFLRHRAILANFLILFDFIFCALFFYYGFKFIDERVRAREAHIIQEKIYNNNALAVDFNISNLSKYNFKYCKIKAKLYKNIDENASFVQRYKAQYLPVRVKSKELNKGIERGRTQVERINFENIDKENNLSIILESECY